MTYWLHLGNVLFLCAYSVKDILWLRVLTVVATLCLVAYYFSCSEQPLYEAIFWNGLFIAVNLVQICRLIMERQPVFLGDEDLKIYNMVFRSLSPREFMKLLAIAEHKKARENEVLLTQHAPVEQLILVSKGKGVVHVDGRYVAEVSPGQFAGEMGFLTEQNASASVVASLAVEYLAWPAEKLRSLFEKSPQLHVKFQGILGVDLVEKLRQEGYASAHPSKVMESYREEHRI